jgi:hypothetical protein
VQQPLGMDHLKAQRAANGEIVADRSAQAVHRTPAGHGRATADKAVWSTLA